MTRIIPLRNSVLQNQTCSLKTNRHQQLQSGFSFVEVLLAIMVISIAVITAVSLSNLANISTIRSNDKSVADTHADRDIARARDINDRLVCNTGTCEIQSSTPDRNSYSPAFSASDTTDSTAFTDFNDLCKDAKSFSTQIRDLGGGLPNGDVEGSNGTVSRAMVQEDAGHRYTLIYTEKATNRVIRSVTLVPSTVAWCPGLIP